MLCSCSALLGLGSVLLDAQLNWRFDIFLLLLVLIFVIPFYVIFSTLRAVLKGTR